MSKPQYVPPTWAGVSDDAGVDPITYGRVLAAWNHTMAQPRYHAQLFGIGGITEDDFDRDEHVPGQLCESNPFCEECYS